MMMMMMMISIIVIIVLILLYICILTNVIYCYWDIEGNELGAVCMYEN